MRSAVSVLVALLLCVSGGLAQDAGAWPLALRGGIETSGSHGCSQSFASSSTRAELELAIDRAGRATLTYEVLEWNMIGPSRGRFAAGERDRTEIHEHTRAVYRGRAASVAGGIALSFDRVEHASARWQGPGTLPLPALQSEATSSSLRCEPRTVNVFPATWSQGEAAQPRSVLACRWEPSPPALVAELEVQTFHLAATGVRTIRSREEWQLDPEELIRASE